MSGGAVVQQVVAQLQQTGVVGGGQRGQSHLLIARVLTGGLAVLRQQLGVPIAHRAVGVPSLTEAAAPDTAPEQLQHHPVVDDLGGGDDGFDREVGLVHVLHDALAHRLRRAGARLDAHLGQGAVLVVDGLIERGDVDALDLGGLLEKLLLGPALLLGLAVELDVLQGHVLPLTQDEQVDEGGQGLRVIGAGPPRHDERGELGPVLRPQGQSGQVQHVQHVGVGHLVPQRKPMMSKSEMGSPLSRP